MARNIGALAANGDVLVFVDADVLPHRDAFSRIRDAFADDGDLTAVFGAYDDRPDADGPVSTFRNLLPHYVHRSSAGPSTSFWSGLGAVRRDRFMAAGGFDGRRFPGPDVEDVELGMRLSEAGARIVLDPSIQATHLKAWTVRGIVRTDLLRRGVPWVSLLLRRRRAPGELNLGRRHQLSALACISAAAALAARRPARAAPGLAVLVLANRPFYALLWRHGGARTATAGVALHVLHHLTAAAAVPLGALAWLRDRAHDGEEPDSLDSLLFALHAHPPRVIQTSAAKQTAAAPV